MKCVFEIVEQQLHQNGDRVALEVETSGQSFTYKELLSKSSIIASKLREIFQVNYKANNLSSFPLLVAVMADRNVGIVASMLGTLQVGAGYVPIDPSFPPDRQAYILEHSQASVIIVDDKNLDSFDAWNKEVPYVLLINSTTGEFQEMRTSQSNIPVTRSTQSTNANAGQFAPHVDGVAYVQYTSGSTGKPKGVMVMNKGVYNIVNFFAELLHITPESKVLCLTTFCFDISVLELYMPLIRGGTCVLCSSRTQKNPTSILNLIHSSGVTIVQATPTTYEMLLSTGWKGDKKLTFLVGGEACRPSVAQLAGNSKAMYNVYGPTETTVWSSCYRLPVPAPGDAPVIDVPIGTPISATQFYILNEKQQPVEDGVEGELWIGGDGVALGYLHAADLTVARFIPDPFVNSHSRCVYLICFTLYCVSFYYL